MEILKSPQFPAKRPALSSMSGASRRILRDARQAAPYSEALHSSRSAFAALRRDSLRPSG
ncbi:MAG TPA: hypothetical protein DEA50_06580 [Parvularcula sp.]|nr:hypothetical protein [Parvularcula sp.]